MSIDSPGSGNVQSCSEDQTRLLLPAWSAACTLVLMGVTWPLWFRPAETTFPQTPLTNLVLDWPQRVDFAISTLVCACLLLVVAGGGFAKGIRSRAAVRCILLCFAVGAASLFTLDQQRLQPWFYFTFLLALLYGVCTPGRASSLARLLVVSVYAYSALGKLDFEFLHTVGQDFVLVLLSWCRVDASGLTDATIWRLTLALPIAEMVLAGLLLLRWTRRLGGWLAALFHLGLVAVFSPLGLGHSWSVILWNVQFAVQALLLFALPSVVTTGGVTTTLRRKPELGSWIGTLIVGCAALLPIGERLGLWDHWLSWALYAPHSSRTEVFVAISAVDRLPEPLRSLMSSPDLDDEVATLWYRVPLKEWCLTENFSPVYPQDRLGVAAAWQVRRFLDTDFEVKLRILGPASRFDGSRTSKEFLRPEDFAALDNQFLLNTRPRRALDSRAMDGVSQ